MNTEAFNKILQELQAESTEIKASALLSADGIMLASQLPADVGEDKLAAMSAALLSVGDRMTSDLLQGVTDRVMIQSSAGYAIVSAVSPELLLAVVACPNAKLGMVFHDINQVAKKIQYLQYAV